MVAVTRASRCKRAAGCAHRPEGAPIRASLRSRGGWRATAMDAIVLVVRIRQRTFALSLALLAVATVAAVVFRKRLEFAAETSAQAVADEARAVLLKRDDQQLQEAFATTRAALAEASAITLYHVANEFDEDYAGLGKRPRVAGYPVRQRMALSRHDAQRLVTLLTTRSTYFPAGEAWSCIFEPRHVFQLTSARASITVVICIHCGDVEFVIGRDSIGTRSIYPKPNDELSRILESYLNSGRSDRQTTPPPNSCQQPTRRRSSSRG